ncbi:Recombination protein RecR [Alteracholeplasma palmae J233]|uniref:Recombination protein RecR n=1 Tax=Alteracholeplasma palmae (strain ATCC 49389 / J233) TaxID=1318466 RepID=U4KLY7_ALTPJ|nr:recombination mediator RecR [Alteracholeplasma palmae]CCV64987.1 Recombination protein RecR [Alteracholeplasma palmae J233]
MYPKSIKDLIEDFSKLPGVGEKTAERFVLFLATQKEKDGILSFSSHLKEMTDKIVKCERCHMLTEDTICDICKSKERDTETLMVVSDSKDVFVFEKMKTYHGQYHVLDGVIDFSKGISPEDLNIDSLLKKVASYKEVIIATNGTVEGELTAKYLKALLSDFNLSITRLAYGLPVGSDLKYADELTLNKAVENRQKY